MSEIDAWHVIRCAKFSSFERTSIHAFKIHDACGIQNVVKLFGFSPFWNLPGVEISAFLADIWMFKPPQISLYVSELDVWYVSRCAKT